MVTATKTTSIDGLSAQAFQKAAVLFSVGFGKLGMTKKLSKALIEVDADADLIRVSKVLLDCPEVERITRMDAAIREWVLDRALPSPLKKGLYLLPQALLEQVDTRLVAYEAEREAAVEALVAVYTERVDEARYRLRAAFNASDYPSVERLREAYWFRFQYLELAAPRDLPDDIAAREAAKLRNLWDEAAQGVRDVLRGALLELVSGLAERLTGERDGGKPKIFRDSAVTKLHDFVSTFQARDITNDEQCAALVERVRGLVDGLEPQALRDDATLRREVKDGFGKIQAELDTLITEAPSMRLFSLDE